MFTSVDSPKKNLPQTSNLDAANSFDGKNPVMIGNESSFSERILEFFSVSDDFFKLQLAIFVLTFVISLILTLFELIIFGLKFGLSLFIGSIAGIFYLRLLSKSISKLGKTSSGITKVQLLIPLCLFIFSSKIELIELIPAVIGFLIYKPAIIFYFSRS